MAVILYQHARVRHLAALCIVTLHWSYSTEMMIIAVLLYVFFCWETALHIAYVKCIFALMAWSNGSLIFLSFILGIPWKSEQNIYFMEKEIASQWLTATKCSFDSNRSRFYTSYIFQASFWYWTAKKDLQIYGLFLYTRTGQQHKFHQKLVANKRHFSKAYFPLEIVLLLLAFILHFHSVVVEVDRTPIWEVLAF